MIRALLMFLLSICLLSVLTGNFTVTMINAYNISTSNISSLDMLKNISDITEEAQNTLNATTPSSQTVVGFDFGGIWVTINKFMNTPNIISSIIAGIVGSFGIAVPGLSIMVNTFGLVLGILLLFGVINFIRSGKEI